MAADGVLALHILFVGFVIGGLGLIGIGALRHWDWIHNARLRWLHLLAVMVVVVQAWLGLVCPLTRLEMALRERAGATTYAGSWIAHNMQQILYYSAPAWMFIVAYSLFGLAVVLSWMRVPPRHWRER